MPVPRRVPRSSIAPTSKAQQLLPFDPPDTLQAVPWAAIRGALFAPLDRKLARKALTRATIATVGDYRIVYTGHQLDQADLDVWLAIVHLSRNCLGSPVVFGQKKLLDDMGKGSGKSQRDWLLECLSRLTACEVEIKKGTTAYAGSLIAEHGRDDSTGMHYVILNPRIASLYWDEEHGGTHSMLQRQERKRLGRKQLAKWLHGFMAGNTHPLTFRIAELQALSGSKYAQERDFRAALMQAAGDVSSVLAHKHIALTWDLRRSLVTIAVLRGEQPD